MQTINVSIKAAFNTLTSHAHGDRLILLCGNSSVVEHLLPKQRVAGSSPVSRSEIEKTPANVRGLVFGWWVKLWLCKSVVMRSDQDVG